MPDDAQLENVFIVCVCSLVVLVPVSIIASVVPMEIPIHRVLWGVASTAAVIGGIVMYCLKT